MKPDISIHSLDSVHIKVYCSQKHVAYELADFFSFEVPDSKFKRKYKSAAWDGKIRLYNTSTKKIYKGLLSYILWYANENELSVEVDPKLKDVGFKIDLDDVYKIAEKINIHAGGNKIQPRDFQAKAVHHVINNDRALIVSPTASGKSLIIYLLVRYFLARLPKDKKILIIVPTTSLVGQMLGDFKDYSNFPENKWIADDNTHCIYKGANKYSEARVFISTWQSIYKMPKKYFEQFGAVFADEAHLAKATSISSIMEKLSDCKFRVGLTGTVGDKNAPVNLLTLEGLFGKKYTTITTRELIDRGQAAKLDINLVKLNYTKEECKKLKGYTYQEEIDYICKHTKRNAFLTKFAGKLKGNSLFLFQKIEHGEQLYNAIKEMYPNRKVYLWHGGIDADKRNTDRELIEKDNDSITVASYGTTSTGTSIKNLHNVIFASPYKSEVKVLQSIGRGLRISKTKTSVKLFDLIDNFRIGEHRNYALKHFLERVELYNQQRFDYEQHSINI